MKQKTAPTQTRISDFPKIFLESKRKPSLIGTDDREQFVNELFTEYLIRKTSKTIVDIYLREQFFPKKLTEKHVINSKSRFLNEARSNANWIDELPRSLKKTISIPQQK